MMKEIRRTTGESIGISLDALERYEVAEIDWHRADLSGLDIGGISFDDAIMRNAELRGVSGANCSFLKSNCILVSFRGAVFVDASFAGAKLRHADFSGAVLHNVKFDGADLTEAQFNGADVEGSSFDEALAQSTDFRGCNITEAQRRTLFDASSQLDQN